jgi:hypothetical protein
MINKLYKVISVSFPRSGHHLLADCLAQYFSRNFSISTHRKKQVRAGDFFYCEPYNHCQNIPCIDKRVNYQKSHDFSLDLDNDGRYKYIVQFRDPIESIVSLYLLETSPDYWKWKEKVDRASYVEDTKESWINFANRNIIYWKKFVNKWIDESKKENVIVISYEELLSNPKKAIIKALKFIMSEPVIDENFLEKVISNKKIGKKSDIKKFKYYDQSFFDYLRRLVKDELVNLDYGSDIFNNITRKTENQYIAQNFKNSIFDRLKILNKRLENIKENNLIMNNYSVNAPYFKGNNDSKKMESITFHSDLIQPVDIKKKITHYIFYHDEELLARVKPKEYSEDFIYIDLNKLSIPKEFRIKGLSEDENRAVLSEYLGILHIKPKTELVGIFTYSIPLKFCQKHVETLGEGENIFLPPISFEDLILRKFDETKLYAVEFGDYASEPYKEIIRKIDKNPLYSISSKENEALGPLKASIIVSKKEFLKFQKWFFSVVRYLFKNHINELANLKISNWPKRKYFAKENQKKVDTKFRTGIPHFLERLVAYYFGKRYNKSDKITLGSFLHNEIGFNLICQYFIIPNEERQSEINECLEKNCKNVYIKKIYLLTEKKYVSNILNHPKVEQIVIGRRLRFSDAFNFANERLYGELCIISNADIFFDQSLCKLKDYDLYSFFVALSRWNVFKDGREQLIIGEPKYDLDNIQIEYDEAGGFLAWSSQDCWIFRSPLKSSLLDKTDFELGRPNCDSYLAFLIKMSYYNLINPCEEVIARHLHNGNYGISRSNTKEHRKNKVVGERYPINSDGSSSPAARHWVQGTNSNGKIKLYSFYSFSHEVFKEKWFLPSIKDDYFLVLKRCDQKCSSGNYNSEGWLEVMLEKVSIIIDAISENWGSIFIYSDMDIQFFDTTKEALLNEIKDKDIVFQRDSIDHFDKSNCLNGAFCAGFFICRANKLTLKLWNDVKKLCKNNPHRFYDDQEALNFLLHDNWYITVTNNLLKFGFLPDIFYSPGICHGYNKWLWTPQKEIDIPDGILLHHANWTIGIENKKLQLEYVRQKVFKKKGYFW